MKLHVIRHAKAASSIGESDFDRPLAQKGTLQAQELARYLQGKIENTTVWCSDAKRTRESFDLIKMNSSFKDILYKVDFYLCEKEVMLEQIWNNAPEGDLIIIGHNFGISDLVNYFTDELILMRTGEYICIDFGELSLKESSKDTGRISDQFRFEA